MIGKTNSNLFEGVNVQFFEKNNNSEIRMPYENMQMKIRTKRNANAFYWARFNYLRNQVLDTILLRVWSWLRMNAGGVPNTCKSSGIYLNETSVEWEYRERRTGE